jgi:acetolactate synthase small subunit
MDDTKLYTIIIFTENKPGVLYRIADSFLKRKINIESLTVSEIEAQKMSRFTITVKGSRLGIEKITKQLYKIIEVVKVLETTDEGLIFKEIALIKVSTKNPGKRQEVEELASLFQAKIVYVGSSYLTIEKSGSEEEINSLYSLLKPFGIREYVRSGRIALTKEEQSFIGKSNNAFIEPSTLSSSIEISAIKRVQLMAKADKKVISLAQGIPSFATPDHIKKAAIDAIKKGVADKYTTGYGIDELREAIVAKVKRDNNISATKDQVIVTHGGIEAMMATFIALLNPSDEIIVLSPDYASHITQTQIARHGGRPIYVPLTETENGWILDSEKVEAAMTQRTKAILMCNPCNPTGKVYSLEELKQLAAIARKYNVFIISDEIYEYFTYDKKKHISIGSLPEVADRVISIFGVSKSYAMTGWRIGYIVANKDLIAQIMKIHDSLVTCPTAVSQYAALAAIKGSMDAVLEFKKEFAKRRQIVIDAVKGAKKIQLIAPEGSYYAFAKIAGNIDDYDLSMRLLHEAKIAVVPGSAFGLGGESHIRISFGGEEKEIREGMRRLVEYIQKCSD